MKAARRLLGPVECLRWVVGAVVLAAHADLAHAQAADVGTPPGPALAEPSPSAPLGAPESPEASSAVITPRDPAGPGRGRAPEPVDTWGTTDVLPPTAPGPDLSGPLPAPCPPPEESDEAGTRVLYTLEAIEVRGAARTRPRVVLRYVPFKIGDVFDVSHPEVELTRFRLLGTGFFRDVEFVLRKGSRKGQVVLVIDVVERPTIVVNNLWMGLSSDRDTNGEMRPLTAYGGVDVAETNLMGTGITLGVALGLALDQRAMRVRFLDPAFLGTRWMLGTQLLFNDALDFFGNSRVTYWAPADQVVRRYPVIEYRRFGGSVGVGRDLLLPMQLWVHYRLESIDAQVPPVAAHDRHGPQGTEAIDFDINPNTSFLSTLSATLQYDSRDHPFLPERGWLTRVKSELGLAPLGSDYNFQKFEVEGSRWWPLPWHHVARVTLLGGAITGYAPFFEQYYVGDLSDFLAGRALGLNFERRPSPNLLGTSIAEVRRGHYAAKLSAEYRVPIYRGHRSVYGIDFYGSAGAFALAGKEDLEEPPTNYHGLARIPLDLTFNLGFRMDTSAGGFVFSLAHGLGFLPPFQ